MKRQLTSVILLLMCVALSADFYKYVWDTGRSLEVRGNIIEQDNNILAIGNGKQLYVYSMFDIYNFTLNGAYTLDEDIQGIEILTSKNVAVAINSIISSKVSIDSLDTMGRTIPVNIYNGNDLQQDGSHLYVAHEDTGLTIYDMGNNMSYNIISNYHDAWGLNSIAVKWPLLYATNNHGVATINLSNVTRPMPFGTNYNIFKCDAVANYNDLLFAASSRTLNILDISIPGKMKSKDSLYYPYLIRGVKVHNNDLYVILGEGGMEIYTINANNTLTHSTSYNDGNYLYDIGFYADYIFMLSKDKYLRILQYN